MPIVTLVNKAVSWLAVLYVVLLPVGRSGLPLNAQWGDLVLLPLAAAAAWSGRLAGWWRRKDWPLAVYLSVTLMTAFTSPRPSTGLQEFAKHAYVAAVFLVFRCLSREPALVRRMARGFGLAVATMAAISIVAVFLLPSGSAPLSAFGWAGAPLPYFGLVLRLRGAFLAPELLGNTLLVAFVTSLAFRAIAPERSRPFWTAIATLLAAAEFLTFSHSVAGFFFAAAVFVAGTISSRLWRVLIWTVAASVILVVNAASVLNPPQRSQAPKTFPEVSFEILGKSVEARLDHYVLLKQAAWSAFLEHPVVGIGPGLFVDETHRAFKEGRITRPQRGLAPHSSLTGRLAESGLLGAASLFLLWVSWIRRGGRTILKTPPLRRAAFAAVLGLLVNSVNADIMNFRFLWVALAWAWNPLEDLHTSKSL